MRPTAVATPVPPLTLTLDSSRGQGGGTISYEGEGHTPVGAVTVVMTADGLIVGKSHSDEVGAISGSFQVPERDRITGESSNDIPAFAIDEATGRASARAIFTCMTTLPAPTPVPSPVTLIGRPVHVHGSSCARLDADPQFDLADLTVPDGIAGAIPNATVADASLTVVPVSIDELLGGEHAIAAHRSHEAMWTVVASGEFGGPKRAKAPS
jgi:hypothetical protein